MYLFSSVPSSFPFPHTGRGLSFLLELLWLIRYWYQGPSEKSAMRTPAIDPSFPIKVCRQLPLRLARWKSPRIVLHESLDLTIHILTDGLPYSNRRFSIVSYFHHLLQFHLTNTMTEIGDIKDNFKFVVRLPCIPNSSIFCNRFQPKILWCCGGIGTEFADYSRYVLGVGQFSELRVCVVAPFTNFCLPLSTSLSDPNSIRG